MQRIDDGPVRENWRQTVIDQGLVYVDTHYQDPLNPQLQHMVSYWREGQYYLLDESEVTKIGVAGAKLYQALIALGEKILGFERSAHDDPLHRPQDCYFKRLSIPETAVGPILRSWQLDNVDESPNRLPEHYPTIYGRYDLALQLDEFGKVAGIKLLEFNADTPTSVVETAVIQPLWLEAVQSHLERRHGNVFQWAGLYDCMVVAWKEEIEKFRRITGRGVDVVHVACTEVEEEGEDYMTIGVIGSALEEAVRQLEHEGKPGFRVKYISMESINRVPTSDTSDTYVVGTMGVNGFNTAEQGVIPGYFVDSEGERIKFIFKLHPWEYFLNPVHTKHGFGETAMHDLMSTAPTTWVEPVWKMIWSNKGILALLWEQYKNDPEIGPYLLPTYFANDPAMPADFTKNCAQKPLLGREGANVTLFKDGSVLEHGGGVYGDEGYVFQQLCLLPEFHDRNEGVMHPVIGLWMVRDEDVDLCVRESPNNVTNNISYFVPHAVRKGH